YLINALRPKLKYAGVIGSYGWGGKAPETVTGLVGTLNLDWFDPVMVKGLPSEEDLAALDCLATQIAERMQASK
ncbi:MAG: FprA family A-type flavoprotein, partial [Phycisphaerae bacterium]|nr:FprA family A-type flavoprotein [Phycisphaerae bacterium]